MRSLFVLLVSICLYATGCFANTDISRLDAEQFPMVMYAVPPTDADFKKVHDMGFDYVHLYGYGFGGDSAETIYYLSVKNYLDLAHKHQLKVMYDLNGSGLVGKGEAGLEIMRNAVKHFKDHPALGFWYLYDEPDIRRDAPPNALVPFYQMLKQEAPDIPVCICTTTQPNPDHKLGYNWSSYGDSHDILSFDTYPVAEHPFPAAQLQAVTNFNRLALSKSKPVMPAVQIFNWNNTPSTVEQMRKNGRKVENLRYPTLQELRYWNFSSLIQGVRGIMYWSYKRAATVEGAKPEWVDITLAPSAREFRTFVNLVHPAHEKQVIDTGAGNEEFMAIWQRKNQKYLVLVNGTAKPRIVKSPSVLQEFNKQQIAPWWFTRAESLKKEKEVVKEIRLEPWEVIIWKSVTN